MKLVGDINEMIFEYETIAELAEKHDNFYLLDCAMKTLVKQSNEPQKYYLRLQKIEEKYRTIYETTLLNHPDNYEIISLLYESLISVKDYSRAFNVLERKIEFIFEKELIISVLHGFCYHSKSSSDKLPIIKAYLLINLLSWNDEAINKLISLLSSYESDNETMDMFISFVQRKNNSSNALKLITILNAFKKDYDCVSINLNELSDKYKVKANDIFSLISLINQASPNLKLKIRLYNFIASKFELQKDMENALKIYSNLRELLPNDLTIKEKLAEIYYSLENFEKSLSIFQEIHKENKNDSKYLRKIGEIYQKLENRDKALENYIEALKIDTNLNSVLEKSVSIVTYQLSEGDIKKANDNARKLTLINFPKALEQKVKKLFKLTESQFKLCKRIDNILNLGDSDKILYSIKDIIEFEKENIYAGIYGLKKLLITPIKNKGMVFFLLGECYNNIKDFNRAINFYTSAEKTSLATDARSMKAYCLIKLENYDEVFKTLNKVPRHTAAKNNYIIELYRQLKTYFDKKGDIAKTKIISSFLRDYDSEFKGFKNEK